jgi:hypothetical protein
MKTMFLIVLGLFVGSDTFGSAALSFQLTCDDGEGLCDGEPSGSPEHICGFGVPKNHPKANVILVLPVADKEGPDAEDLWSFYLDDRNGRNPDRSYFTAHENKIYLRNWRGDVMVQLADLSEELLESHQKDCSSWGRASFNRFQIDPKVAQLSYSVSATKCEPFWDGPFVLRGYTFSIVRNYTFAEVSSDHSVKPKKIGNLRPSQSVHKKTLLECQRARRAAISEPKPRRLN